MHAAIRYTEQERGRERDPVPVNIKSCDYDLYVYMRPRHTVILVLLTINAINAE